MSDVQDSFDCQQDEQAKKGFMSTPKNLAEVKKDIRRNIAQYKQKKPAGQEFVIEIKGEYAGHIGMHSLNEKFEEHKGKIGYCVNKKFRGKGIATEAVKLLTKYAFKKYKLKRIEGWCRTFNKASAGVLKNAGYKLEGILRKNKKKNDKYLDDMVWAKVK